MTEEPCAACAVLHQLGAPVVLNETTHETLNGFPFLRDLHALLVRKEKEVEELRGLVSEILHVTKPHWFERAEAALKEKP
jgi:hypothetical protein